MSGAAIHGLAVSLPTLLRTNEYWRRHHPQLIDGVNDHVLSKVWTEKPEAAVGDPWADAMRPYVHDPFRGAVARRWLGPGETALSLEIEAAEQVLSATGLTASDIDLAVVTSFQPDQPGVGNAAFLARALGLRGAAWNLETACSSALVGVQTAASYVIAGQARAVLVVASCTYSRAVAETDSLAWSVGDAACAFIVGASGRGADLLSFETLHTGQTCGAMYYDIAAHGGTGELRMRAGTGAAAQLRNTAEWAIEQCCQGAVRKAGVAMADIDFFATTTPMAWYADFCARRLGYSAEQTYNSHPMTANTGPVLMPQNLFFGAHEKRLRPGRLALLHTVGSVSSASAAVLRWGDVALGPMPPPPTQGE
jgi:3-oxoacyl-[acyl-carrier-protein] synthase-3